LVSGRHDISAGAGGSLDGTAPRRDVEFSDADASLLNLMNSVAVDRYPYDFGLDPVW
jgi:hypothetical protein